ncbi:Invasion protein IalB, involved in pathogenesis [Tistlia consotensis]|uniref:Invasion protein IalB, involved in pathogenesis n=1 Tax=Tistlia consotensis USBA 355 TaxID=560819 RepID=A0A1Y6CKG3_9PROT|nr:invasion associated locus B family protein [Tistlia consotensis]SMF72820.1 Invasion protein IalB, involved in pathogenesis [Tistlia consotensis USBA 355]SNS09778.1 Invasion protein IalB, involved in pathogenesis [Tistlia consotensis]
MPTMRYSIPFLLCVLLLAAGTARAQDVQRVGDFQAWSAYVAKEGDGKVCFVASKPLKSEGNYTRRGTVVAMVTRRPGRVAHDEVSIQAGYSYKPGEKVKVDVDDDTKFEMVTKDEYAWLPRSNGELDKKLISAMVNGLNMTVRGFSARDTLTTDTFSLRGFTAAYDAMQKACK